MQMQGWKMRMKMRMMKEEAMEEEVNKLYFEHLIFFVVLPEQKKKHLTANYSCCNVKFSFWQKQLCRRKRERESNHQSEDAAKRKRNFVAFTADN